MVDRHPGESLPNHIRRHIKGGRKRHTGALEVKVFHQGPAQVARPQNDRVVAAVHTQNVGNLPPQIFNIIAVALLAEPAEAGEILPDL